MNKTNIKNFIWLVVILSCLLNILAGNYIIGVILFGVGYLAVIIDNNILNFEGKK